MNTNVNTNVVRLAPHFPKKTRPLSQEEKNKYRTPNTGGFGTLVASLLVPSSLVDMIRHENQNRAKDINLDHVSRLMRDIETRGLENPPFVEYDTISEKFIPLSYHRCTGMVEAGWETMPVRVMQFDNLIEKRKFLDYQNNHPPALSSDLDDAVLSIQNYNGLGYFAGMNKDQIKKEVYSLLDQFHSSLHTSKKSAVVQRVFKFDKSRFKNWTATNRKEKLETIRSQDTNDVYYSTDNSNVRKLLGLTISNLSSKKAKAISDNTAWKRKNIHAVVSIALKAADGDISQKRKTVLHQVAEMNRYGIHPKLAFVKSITFVPQVLEPISKKETEDIVYYYDEDEKEFLLS